MNILLIEDDARIAGFIMRGLTAENHRIEWARDGTDGYAKARAGGYDAIILDLMLPGMDGREVCRRLRADGICTKILMLTALETTADVVAGLRMGADDYLTKPFAFDELTARLEVFARAHACAGHGDAVGGVLEAGAVRFDTAALAVTVAGAPVSMTSLEYALLEFLMVHRGKVLSRARILQDVWGAHEDPLTNVVDVYIRRLRAKLSDAGAPEMIDTVRGRGYRLG